MSPSPPRSRTLALACLLPLLAAPAHLASARARAPEQNTAPTAPSADRIPLVRGTNLAGESIELPTQLQGKVGVLVLGFSKDSRVPTRDWGHRLAADYLSNPAVSFFEMPVLASVPRLLRGLVLRQIADTVSPAGKPHFVPITNDEGRWRELVHYQQPDDAYILVVDGAGMVHDHYAGALTEAAYAGIRRSIAALQPSPRSAAR